MIKFQQLSAEYSYCFISYNTETNVHQDWSITNQKSSKFTGNHLFDDYQKDSVQFEHEGEIE